MARAVWPIQATGIFTAVAIEGFRLAAELIGSVATGPDGFVHGGEAYVGFALTHRGHFEVMFRPNLYRGDDPELLAAKSAAFDVMYGSARAGLEARREQPVTEDEVRGLVLAGWSASRSLSANPHPARLAPDRRPAALSSSPIQQRYRLLLRLAGSTIRSPGASVRGLQTGSHGFATLALTANLPEQLGADPTVLAAQVVRGYITMGELAGYRG